MCQSVSNLHVRERFGGPSGIRTRVAALKGLCPWPLDDGTSDLFAYW